MAATLSTAAKNAMLDALTALIDAGSAAGYMDIKDSGDVVLAHLVFHDPSFAAADSGSVVLDNDTAIADSSANASGTASYASIYDSDDTAVITAITCGAGSGQLNMSSLSITAGDTITLTGAGITITMA